MDEWRGLLAAQVTRACQALPKLSADRPLLFED
jgi:hypothetical protein